MIRKLLASTALATLVASGAMAQTTTPAPQDPIGQNQALPQDVPLEIKAEGHLASGIVGGRVYSGTGEDAANIGKVNDIVISPDGELQAVVIGVGGFLGIGRKDVAIQYDLVEWTEMDGERYMVVETSADALKALPDFDYTAYRPMPIDAQVTETKPATAEDLSKAEQMVAAQKAAEEAATQEAAQGDVPAEQAPAEDLTAQGETTDETQTSAIGGEALEPLATDEIGADEFVGIAVLGADEQSIGEISDIALAADGSVDAVIVDVGAFVGSRDKQVALGIDNLMFMADGEGNRSLHTDLTKEQLDAQPAYDAATYAEQRDAMRMVVPN